MHTIPSMGLFPCLISISPGFPFCFLFPVMGFCICAGYGSSDLGLTVMDCAAILRFIHITQWICSPEVILMIWGHLNWQIPVLCHTVGLPTCRPSQCSQLRYVLCSISAMWFLFALWQHFFIRVVAYRWQQCSAPLESLLCWFYLSFYFWPSFHFSWFWDPITIYMFIVWVAWRPCCFALSKYLAAVVMHVAVVLPLLQPDVGF